ncbi:MAG: hypothetical protein JNM22_19350 [Saprospiraceae bacterium]|nr:hypothetical protein [Saprospiraceae bacterium]
MRKTLILIWTIFSCITLYAQGADNWSLRKDKDGMKVYYRQTVDVHEIKIATSLKIPLSGIIQLFAEVDNYPKWGYKVMESRLLQKVSDTEMYYYSRLDFPWPMSDRDIIMHTRLSQDPITRRITATSVAAPDYIPVVKDVERMRSAHTQWTLVPGNGGWVYVEYYIHSHPGGNIPDWLVNMAVDVGPRETIKNIRNIIQQQRYQTAKLAYIKE